MKRSWALPIRLEFDQTPPSLNRVGASGGWRQWERHKKAWQDNIGFALLAAVQPKRRLLTPVVADALLYFPQMRRRDEGNYRSILEKACGDALVAGFWIPDDTPDCFRFRSVTFAKKPRPMTLLELTEAEIAWTSSTSRS